jgi:hypothetical protein
VFSSRRYFVLTNTGLLCYANKEDRSEVRDSFPLAPDTQVVEIKIKGARRGGREGESEEDAG